MNRANAAISSTGKSFAAHFHFRSIRRILAAASIFAAALICDGKVEAATDTWDGGGADNLWTDSNNWGGATPNANALANLSADSLVFSGTVNTTTSNNYTYTGTNSLAAFNSAFNGITFADDFGSFTLNGNEVLLTGQVQGNNVGIFNDTGATQTVNLPVNLDWGYYTFGNVGGSGTLALNGGSTTSFTGVSNGAVSVNAGGVAMFNRIVGDGTITTSTMTNDASGLINGLGGAALVYTAVTNGGVGFSGLATVTSNNQIGQLAYTGTNVVSAIGAIGATSASSGSNIELTATKGLYTLNGGTGVTYFNTILAANNTGTTTIGTSNSTIVLGAVSNTGGVYTTSTANNLTVIGNQNNNTAANSFITVGNGFAPGEIVFAQDGTANNTANVMELNGIVENNNLNGNNEAVTVVKAGWGSMNVENANTYTGGTYITQGQMQFNNMAGAGTGGIYVAGGATLFFTNTTGTNTNQIYLSPGLGVEGKGAMKIADGNAPSGTDTFTGTITLQGAPVTTGAGDRIFINPNTGTVSFTGKFAGTGTLDLDSGGASGTTVMLDTPSGGNTFFGNAIFETSNGTSAMLVKNGANNQLVGNSLTMVPSGGTGLIQYNLNGYNETIGALNSAVSPNNIVENGATTGSNSILTIEGTNPGGTNAGANGSFGGVLEDGTGGGTLSILKIGAGTQTISGAGIYTGSTTVNGGVLNLTGSLSGATSIQTMNSGVFTESSGGVINASGVTFTQGSTGASVFAGANSYTGATTVNAGTLDVNGTLTSSVVTVNGGTIGGTGTLGTVNVASGAGAVANGAAGNSSGELTVGSLTYSGNGVLGITLAGGANTTTPGINVTGALTTANTGGGEITVNAATASSWQSGSIYDLLNAGGLTGGLSDFTLGTVSGLSGRETAVLGLSGSELTLDITGGSPYWTGAANGAWTTGTIGGAGNWVLEPNGTETDFESGDNSVFDDSHLTGNAVTTLAISDNTVTPGSVTFGNNTHTYTITSPNGNGIGGTGPLSMVGTGTLVIDTSNSYSGGTSISSSGTVVLGASGANLGAATGALTLNGFGGTLDLGGNSITVGAFNGAAGYDGFNTGVVTSNGGPAMLSVNNLTSTNTIYGGLLQDGSGQLSLTVLGTGTLTLAGTNTYSGVTIISNGATLAIGGTGGLGNPTGFTGNYGGNIMNNGSFVYGGTASQTLSGVISGSGTLTVTNAAELTLTGANTYTGSTIINGDFLFINGAGALGAGGTYGGSISFGEGGTLIFNSSSSMTLAGVISGAGGLTLTKNETGTITLTAAETYTGGTNVSGSTLVLSAANNQGGLSANSQADVLVDDGGTIFISGDNNFLGSGANFPLVSVDGGTLELGSTYTAHLGYLELQGGTLATGGPGLGGSEAAYGSWNLDDTVTVIGGGIMSATNMTLSQNGGTIFDVSSGSTSGIDLLVSGAFAKTAGSPDTGLIKNNNGVMELSGTNTFDSNITINGGELMIGGAGVIASAGDAEETNTYIGNIAIANGAAFVYDSSQNQILPGAISGVGSLIQEGTGTLTVEGTNTYTGPTSVLSGTLFQGRGTLSGTAITTTNTGVFVQSAATFTSITGASSFTQDSTGTSVLTDSNSFTGSVKVDNGTLQFTQSSALGSNTNVTLAGASSSAPGVLNYTGTNGTLSQNLTVTAGDYGAVVNSGGGVLTVDGNVSKNGSVFTLAGGRFVVNGAITGSSNNSDIIIGSSTLASGSATVGLTNTSNSYNGPTTIDDGSTLLTGTNNVLPSSPPSNVTLGSGSDTAGQVNTLDLLGTSQTIGSLTASGSGTNQVISSNGSATGIPGSGSGASATTAGLTVNYSGSPVDTFSGSIGGSGAATNLSLTKTGTGTLVLGGVNTYTGATTINAGMLKVTGSAANSATTVGHSSVLAGDGLVGSIYASAGSTVSPGANDVTQVIGANLSTSTNNILTASSLQMAGGATLQFNLYTATVGTGSAGNPAGGTLIDLGTTGSFLSDGSVSSSNQIILDFQDTGAGGTSASSPNIYDLVEFSSTGGPNGDTNLTISDFDLVNLDSALGNGNSTLSFINMGDGQEALQLSVAPEPSTWAMVFGGLGFLGFLLRGRLRLRGGAVCGSC
ncbi:MAG TPA: autotransporter-associated beta strand repeat-containing protein [Candidatus Methylacidiphilales bacterium]|nr:autotransporter-associated beta strand repeat-containing protein [Candidatus Methylacidiphilales bacterium]